MKTKKGARLANAAFITTFDVLQKQHAVQSNLDMVTVVGLIGNHLPVCRPASTQCTSLALKSPRTAITSSVIQITLVTSRLWPQQGCIQRAHTQ